MTMQLIATVTAPSGGSRLIFENIPQTFTDLFLVVSARTSRSDLIDDVYFFLNSYNDGTFNYRRLFGTGSATSSNSVTGSAIGFLGLTSAANSTTNTFGNLSAYFTNYRGNTAKTVSSDAVSENNGTTAYQYITGNLWSSTAAITRIEMLGGSADFIQNSTASLYGITRA